MHSVKWEAQSVALPFSGVAGWFNFDMNKNKDSRRGTKNDKRIKSHRKENFEIKRLKP
jgi:hypothetical protein